MIRFRRDASGFVIAVVGALSFFPAREISAQAPVPPTLNCIIRGTFGYLPVYIYPNDGDRVIVDLEASADESWLRSTAPDSSENPRPVLPQGELQIVRLRYRDDGSLAGVRATIAFSETLGDATFEFSQRGATEPPGGIAWVIVSREFIDGVIHLTCELSGS